MAPRSLNDLTRPAALLLCLLTTTALAQAGQAKVTQLVPEGEPKSIGERPPSWDYTLSLSANFALAQNSNMVGQPEGTSYLIGLGVIGSVLHVNGRHEVKTTFALVESFTKTPVLDRIVKANDLARLEVGSPGTELEFAL